MAPRYIIYTMPGCPHCVTAKRLFDEKSIPYTTTLLATSEERLNFKRRTGYQQFPQVFELNADGQPIRFIGGADQVQQIVGGG